MIVSVSAAAFGAAIFFALLFCFGFTVLIGGAAFLLFKKSERKQKADGSQRDYYFSLSGIFLLLTLGSSLIGFVALTGLFSAAFGGLVAYYFLFFGFLYPAAVVALNSLPCAVVLFFAAVFSEE